MVVPVAILVALSLSAIGGGLGGLGGLSQLVSGPSAPGSDVTVDDGESEIGDAVTQLAATETGSGGFAAPPGTAPGTQPPAGRGPGGGDAPGGLPPQGGVPPPGGEDTGPVPPGGGGGGGTPTPPEPPEPGVVEGVGQTVTDLTSDTPVAPTVEDAVDGLVEVCGRLGCP